MTRVSPRLAAHLALALFLTPPRRRLDPEDAPVVARATRRRLEAGRGTIAALEWLAPQPGAPTILVLHGWGSHAARFGSFVDPLLAAGFSVVGIDAPAHGESSGRQSDLDRFRQGLRAALARYAPVVGIVAHSMGANAAVWQLADEPHPDLRALVAIAMPRDAGYMMDSFTLVLELRRDVAQRVRGLFTRRFGAPPESFSAHALAARIAVPTLVVHDRDDEVAPIDHAREFAARLRRSHFRETQGLAHSGALRHAQTIAEIVGFLRQECR